MFTGNEVVQYGPKPGEFNVEDWLTQAPTNIKQEAQEDDDRHFDLETPMLSPVMEDVD